MNNPVQNEKPITLKVISDFDRTIEIIISIIISMVLLKLYRK